MVDHLQSLGMSWNQCTGHVKVRDTLSKMGVFQFINPIRTGIFNERVSLGRGRFSLFVNLGCSFLPES